jgi:hypothetical protein
MFIKDRLKEWTEAFSDEALIQIASSENLFSSLRRGDLSAGKDGLTERERSEILDVAQRAISLAKREELLSR